MRCEVSYLGIENCAKIVREADYDTMRSGVKVLVCDSVCSDLQIMCNCY